MSFAGVESIFAVTAARANEMDILTVILRQFPHKYADEAKMRSIEMPQDRIQSAVEGLDFAGVFESCPQPDKFITDAIDKFKMDCRSYSQGISDGIGEEMLSIKLEFELAVGELFS
jgi:hypothetical protein